MKVKPIKHNQLVVLFIVCLHFLIQTAAAQSGGFAGGVSPSRFEISAKPGDLVRRSISIYNLGDRPTDYRISTADWGYSDKGEISFSANLAEDSCRPWVKLERRQISIVPNPNQARSFRFEMHVPEGQADIECRFAVMMESLGKAHQTSIGGSINLPVTGRIAVIVYLQIGKVDSNINLSDITVKQYQGKLLPIITISNTGDAHGRLDSDLSGTTADGKRIALHIATSPIMPNQTRELPLHIEGDVEGQIYPLKVKGKIYSDNQTFSVNAALASP